METTNKRKPTATWPSRNTIGQPVNGKIDIRNANIFILNRTFEDC